MHPHYDRHHQRRKTRSKCGQLQHNCLLKLWFIFIETNLFIGFMQFFTLKTRSLPTLSKGWLGAMFPIVKHQCEHCEHLSSTNPEGNCPKSTITAITAHDSNTTPTWIITYWLINGRLVSVFFARLKKMELVWWQVNTLKFPNNPIWKLLKNPTSRDVTSWIQLRKKWNVEILGVDMWVVTISSNLCSTSFKTWPIINSPWKIHICLGSHPCW